MSRYTLYVGMARTCSILYVYNNIIEVTVTIRYLYTVLYIMHDTILWPHGTITLYHDQGIYMTYG